MIDFGTLKVHHGCALSCRENGWVQEPRELKNLVKITLLAVSCSLFAPHWRQYLPDKLKLGTEVYTIQGTVGCR